MPAPSDIKSFPHEKPDLSPLPSAVANRLEDMWRVGAILSRRFYDKCEADHLRGELKEVRATLIRHAMARSPDGNAALDEAFKAPSHYNYQHTKEEFEARFKLNNWVDTTHNECNRLACEVELVFFQMAVELLPDKRRFLDQLPLLDCLRRVRNVSVHHKPLSFSSDEFLCAFTYESHPSVPPIKIRQTEAWYLDVQPSDLEKSYGPPLNPDVANWFVRQADRLPLSYLLNVAVVQLSEDFTTAKLTSVASATP
jgi:hypothetical protein